MHINNTTKKLIKVMLWSSPLLAVLIIFMTAVFNILVSIFLCVVFPFFFVPENFKTICTQLQKHKRYLISGFIICMAGIFIYILSSFVLATYYNTETKLFCASTQFRASTGACIVKCSIEKPLKGIDENCYSCSTPEVIDLIDVNNPTCPERIVIPYSTQCANYVFSILKGTTYDLKEMTNKIESKYFSCHHNYLSPPFLNDRLLFFLPIWYVLLLIGCSNVSKKMKIWVFMSPVMALLLIFVYGAANYYLAQL